MAATLIQNSNEASSLYEVIKFNKGILLRGFLCLLVSLIVLQYEESQNYEFRNKMNGSTVNMNIESSNVMRAKTPYTIMYLIVLLCSSILIIFAYPISVSFLFFLWLSALTFLISICFFDIKNIWIPFWTPFIQLVFTFILFVSFKLSLKENATWRLNHEMVQKNEFDDLKNNFIGLISHDLKTPISKIQGIIDRLLLQNTSKEFESDLNKLRDENTELLKYIKTILKVLQIESQKIKLNLAATDINILINEVITQLQPIADGKKIQIELDLEPMFLVNIDSLLIREVILNLVDNAIKYSEENSTIKVSSSDLENEILVLVEDKGIGITQSDHNRVFDKFYRGQNTHALSKGTGLGLYLVKYFINLHNGKTILQSQEGKGTSIGFSIPIGEV